MCPSDPNPDTLNTVWGTSACANLPVEQFPNEPSPYGGGYQKMARQKIQKPKPKRRGKQWVIQVREDVVTDGHRTRKNNRVALGPSSLTRAEVEDFGMTTWPQSMRPASVSAARVCSGTLSEYTNATFFRRCRAQHRSVPGSVLKNHLNPAFGTLMLREITLEILQGYFARLQATKLSAESVDKIRDVASAVLRTAVDYGRLVANPAEKIRLKLKGRRLHKPKPFLRRSDFYDLLEAIQEPYSTMVFVAAHYCAQGQRTRCPEVAQRGSRFDHHR